MPGPTYKSKCPGCLTRFNAGPGVFCNPCGKLSIALNAPIPGAKKPGPPATFPEQLNVTVPKGTGGPEGRATRAAKAAGDDVVSAMIRRLLEAEYKRLGL